MNPSESSPQDGPELEEFVRKLSRLRPVDLDPTLSHRLEMALHRADEERIASTKIIYHPFVRWTAAAAALVLAMGLAYESTLQRGSAMPLALEESRPITEREIRPVYQVVNGRMVQSSNQQVMERASYKGIRVIDGKAYRHYEHGNRAYWEPALDPSEPKETQMKSLSQPNPNDSAPAGSEK
jgi:hypothetical protein